ncbi:DUF5667 domain-containing protein [Streptomyces sp. NPDC101132]|uniref:DUF5667 domain-containing protein n=1 Tax=Streptomyces sp. NPDC101132 TaxID=3366110 RepID=UPI003812D67B
MIANVSAHRRANAFAQALEDRTLSDPAETAAEQPDAPADPAEPADYDRMLALANVLDALPRPELDPEVKVVQRAQLVAAMETMVMEGTFGAGASTDPQVPEQRTGRGAHRATSLRKLRPRSRWSKGIAAGGLTVGVAAGAFSGVAAASTDALPGDSLYPVKRGMEDLKLGMAEDDSDRGELYLDQASTRLHEARRLMERGRSGALDHESLGEIRRALSGMKHDAEEGHRLLHAEYERDGSLGAIQALSSFSRSHREAWGQLRQRLPAQLTDVGDEVNSVFDAIDDEVAPLQSLLPKTPEQHREAKSAGGAGADQGTGRAEPGGRHAAPSASPDPQGRTPERPGPSESGDDDSEGLLGGGTGDLLDPPKESKTTPPATSSSSPKPDITLPPILPGILPGLGLGAEDAE